ncbi:hypothetical protein T439DRAFT_184970 [Meredithblackwellia eburnea MCA 4105]
MAGEEQAPVLFETALLTILRAAFFLACRHFVNISLFSGLRQVIHEDGLVSDIESPLDSGAIALDDAENGYFPSTSGGAGAGSSNGSGASSSSVFQSKGRVRTPSVDGSASPPGGANVPLLSPHKTQPSRRDSNVSLSGKPVINSAVAYSKLAKYLFCLCFSESCMLFTLVLFGDAVSDRARTLNWSISLLTLLFLIVFVIPFGLCLLLTYRSRTTLVRSLILTLIPFGIYVFVFYRVGSYIASKIVVEGSHSLGIINGLLSRICAPGVILIASLSGGGAVSTAWEAFEWRSISSAEPVTEAQIIAAERSLYRARLDLQQRTKSLSLATQNASLEAEATAMQSVFSRWTSSTPAAAHLASLQIEVKAMENMETQMVRDVAIMRRKKELRELGRSFKGRLWLAAGWALSIYCVWRVFVSCINLVFGYSQKHHRSPGQDTGESAGTDLITSLLSRLALLLNIDIDIASWSRLIGLALIGGIILANMRNVLGRVSRIFKATSTGLSASFMLLFLALLMSMYLITSLISLPSSPSESSAVLLDTLPDFNVFSRLFDSVFLLAAGSVFVLRWIERKIRVEDVLAY